MADTFKLVTIYKVATANIRDVLFEGEAGNFDGTTQNIQIPLSRSYNNYDILGFYARTNWNGAYRYFYTEVPTELLDNVRTINHNDDDKVSFCWGYGTSIDFCDINKTTTDTKLNANIGWMLITKIVGIKYVNIGTLINNTQEVTNND